MTFDRFSSPLDSERVNPYHLQLALDEQNALNKRDMIDEYLNTYYNLYNTLPTAEAVQEALYRLDIDQDIINDRLSRF